VKELAIASITTALVAARDAAALSSLVSTLRPFFTAIPKARTAKIVRSVIDALGEIPDSTEAQVTMCEATVAWCRAEKRSFLRLRVQLKLAALLLEQQKMTASLAIVNGLLREVKRLDDKALLVDLHLIESRVYHAIRNIPKARAALTASRTAAGSIYVGPETQAAIDLHAGVLCADEGDFRTAFSCAQQTHTRTHARGSFLTPPPLPPPLPNGALLARADFFEAFEGGNSMSDPGAAVPLKHMLLCKVMMDAPDDVPSLISSKGGLKYAGPHLEALRAIAQAYKDRSLTSFERVLVDFSPQLRGDAFIARHITHLADKLLEKNLLRIVEPFSCVEIAHVAALIGLPAERVEAKLGLMILDKKFEGTLDQGRGHLIVFDSGRSDKAYELALATIGNLSGVVGALSKRVENAIL
jgi:26S proteasome regulatory subunit N6